MGDYEGEITEKSVDVVEGLIRQPRKNLESRIMQLEKEIQERLRLRDCALSALGSQRLRLESDLRRSHYSLWGGQGQQIGARLKHEIVGLEEQIIQERSNCFRDLTALRERLQLAEEEVELERLRVALVADRGRDNETLKPLNTENDNRRRQRAFEKT